VVDLHLTDEIGRGKREQEEKRKDEKEGSLHRDHPSVRLKSSEKNQGLSSPGFPRIKGKSVIRFSNKCIDFTFFK